MEVAAIERESTGGRPTLLLAEADPAGATSGLPILTEYFGVLEVVTDGETLIAQVNELQPDVVVMDVDLRGLDGLSATITIRQRYPSVPIVVVTDRTDPALRPVALAVGASAFFLKVDATDTLVAVLHVLVRNRIERQEYVLTPYDVH
jgi:two-component system NarL family response regulator